ncbi:YeeE/YedE family protein [Sinorhizobium fredii]|uniref:YeeE/YedE family protein n=1 Tax=Rhizobium fredii TaxID=380 RepID=UPI00059569F2|nr:YeeE/YedE family protein [Sinorhizobium fredii]WOS65408.1 YeeE/YedE family protein [Sinorhizobium fredii GR64]
MTARIFASILCGLIFGAGLVISDMVNPGRVLAFLDLAGSWDPSLAFVMGAALIPSAVAYIICGRRSVPLLDSHFHVPTNKSVDRKLVAGSALFGLGWGLVGFCPGPAVAASSTGRWEAVLFVAAMLVGMSVYRLSGGRRLRTTAFDKMGRRPREL